MTDAAEVISNAAGEKKPASKRKQPSTNAVTGTVLFMVNRTGSWTTPSGVSFTRQLPYQLVPDEEIEALLKSGRFRRAEPEEVRDFYNIEL